MDTSSVVASQLSSAHYARHNFGSLSGGGVQFVCSTLKAVAASVISVDLKAHAGFLRHYTQINIEPGSLPPIFKSSSSFQTKPGF